MACTAGIVQLCGDSDAEVLVCVCVSARAGRGRFSSYPHCYPPSLFLSPLFLRAGILLKQIGANRLCHCTTQGSPNREGASQKKRKKANRGGCKGGIKEWIEMGSWRRGKRTRTKTMESMEREEE